MEACIGEIRRGEIYQANIACEVGLRLRGGVHEAWARIVEAGARDGAGAGAPARAALVADRELAAVSASPELFLRRDGREVRTDPIKGTRPRTGAATGGPGDGHHPDDGAADVEQHRRLAGSVKDAAENVMIVDLMRNDLARSARPAASGWPGCCRCSPIPACGTSCPACRAGYRSASTTARCCGRRFRRAR